MAALSRYVYVVFLSELGTVRLIPFIVFLFSLFSFLFWWGVVVVEGREFMYACWNLYELCVTFSNEFWRCNHHVLMFLQWEPSFVCGSFLFITLVTSTYSFSFLVAILFYFHYCRFSIPFSFFRFLCWYKHIQGK